MTTYQSGDPTKKEKALAWSVHLYTASGALFGLLAILAVIEEKWVLAFVWMMVTMFIDAVDGTLARRFRVKDVVPHFDGALLDNMVDFFTYVLVPTFIIYQANLVPAQLVIITIGFITISSSYQFCRTDAKTDDHYFTGFPSYWNIVIMYLFMMGAGQWLSFAILLLCAVLIFVPVKYLYPSRTKAFQKLTLAISTIWGLTFATSSLLYPNAPMWLMWLSLSTVIYYIGMSLYMTYQTR